MSVQSISSVQSAALQNPAAELQDILKSGGKAKPAGGAGGGSGGAQDSTTVVSTISVSSPDGTITTTTTYADGSTSVATTLDPNAPSKTDKTSATQPTATAPLDTNDPAQFSTLLQAQENSSSDQITPRLKGDLADL